MVNIVEVPFSNSIGDLKKNIEYLIGKERSEGNFTPSSLLYVTCLLNIPQEDVQKLMKGIGGNRSVNYT